MKLIRGFLVHAALLNSVFMGSAMAAPADLSPIKSTNTTNRAKKKASPNFLEDKSPNTKELLSAGALKGVIDNSSGFPELVIVDNAGEGNKEIKTLRRIPLGEISTDGEVSSTDSFERILFKTPSGRSFSFSLDDNGYVVDSRVLPFLQSGSGAGSPGLAQGAKSGIKSIDFDSKTFNDGSTTLEFDVPVLAAGQVPVSLAVIRNIAGTSIGFDINSNEILVDGQRSKIGPNSAFNAANPFEFSHGLGAFIDSFKIHIVKTAPAGAFTGDISIEFLG